MLRLIRRPFGIAGILCLGLPALSAMAGPLQEASISKIINEVRVVDPAKGTHPAVLDEKIKDDIGVKTGVKSRAELMFQDATLTRLGAETYFSFQPGTRDMTLREGTLLLQVPKGLGGAKIHTAAVTASITGTTIMIESWPGRDVKVLVLEGSLRLSVDGRIGEAVTLLPGKMLLMKPGERHLPEPVDVDLGKLIKTSALIDPATFKGKSKISVAPLPSLGLIQKEVGVQTALKLKAGLVDTNLIISGKGNNVVAASPATMAALDSGVAPKALTIAAVSATALGAQQTDTELTPSSSHADDKANVVRANQDGNSKGFNDRPTVVTPQKPQDGTQGTEEPGDQPAKLNFALHTIATPSPYTVSAASQIDTGRLHIATGGTLGHGGLYFGSAASLQSASEYLFTSLPFRPLDGRFDYDLAQRESGLGWGNNGLAVFRFASLQLGDAPVFAGSRLNLALVSRNGVATAATSGLWELDRLKSLTLAADNGSILLGRNLQALAPTPFRLFDAYARTGGITVSADLALPLATVALWAGGSGGIDLTGTGAITAARVVLTADRAVLLDGAVKATSLSILAGQDVTVHRAPLARLDVAAPGLISTVDLNGQGGNLTLGADGLQAGNHQIAGFGQIAATGSVSAASLQAATAISVGGAIVQPVASSTLQIDAPAIAAGGGISANGRTGPTPGDGGQLTLFANSLLIGPGYTPGLLEEKKDGQDDHGDSSGAFAFPTITGLSANGGAATGLLPVSGGSGGAIDLGTSARPIAGDVIVNQAVTAANGAGPAGALTGGAGGAVRVVAAGAIAIHSSVKVSDATARTGGQIRLESRQTSGTAIAVSSSGQLLSLMNAASVGPGGTVQFVSAGGDIAVIGGKVQADRGTVDLRNNGAGSITLANATLHGDVVKVGALGTNGQLIVGGGVIDADSTIALYAGGSNGTVLFNKSVTLSGTSAKTIAANTVTIANGQKVNIGGPAANVYTDHGNYSGSGGNGSTKGTFTGSGASTHPLAGAPPF